MNSISLVRIPEFSQSQNQRIKQQIPATNPPDIFHKSQKEIRFGANVYGKPLKYRVIPWVIGGSTVSTFTFIVIEVNELAAGAFLGVAGILALAGHMLFSHVALPASVMYERRQQQQEHKSGDSHEHSHGGEVLYDAGDINVLNRKLLEEGAPPAFITVKKGRYGELVPLGSLDEMIIFMNSLHEDAGTGVFLRKVEKDDKKEVIQVVRGPRPDSSKLASNHEAKETAKVIRSVAKNLIEVEVVTENSKAQNKR